MVVMLNIVANACFFSPNIDIFWSDITNIHYFVCLSSAAGGNVKVAHWGFVFEPTVTSAFPLGNFILFSTSIRLLTWWTIADKDIVYLVVDLQVSFVCDSSYRQCYCIQIFQRLLIYSYCMQISYRKQALLSIRGQISCKGKVFPDLRWWSYPVINLEIQTLRHHRIRLILTLYDNMSKYDENC